MYLPTAGDGGERLAFPGHRGRRCLSPECLGQRDQKQPPGQNLWYKTEYDNVYLLLFKGVYIDIELGLSLAIHS